MVKLKRKNNVFTLCLQGIKDPKRGLQQTVSLPIQMANLQGYREADLLIVETPKGLTVSCNAVYQLCQIRVSGWKLIFFYDCALINLHYELVGLIFRQIKRRV